MKFLIAFFMLFLIVNVFCFSQSKMGYLSIAYGKSYSYFKYTNQTKKFSKSPLVSSVLSIGYSYPILSFIDIGIDYSILEKGVKIDTYPIDYHIIAKYSDIGFNMNFHLPNKKKKVFEPYIIFNTIWGICKSGEISNSLEKPYKTNLNTTNYSDFNFAFEFGAGFKFNTIIGQISPEVIYETGMTNTYSDKDFYDYTGEKDYFKGINLK